MRLFHPGFIITKLYEYLHVCIPPHSAALSTSRSRRKGALYYHLSSATFRMIYYSYNRLKGVGGTQGMSDWQTCLQAS